MSVVRDFERAFNRQDVSALLDCFIESGRYHDNFFGEHAGRGTLSAMFERMFREGRDYRWTMDTVVETAARAAAEWTFSYVVTEATPMLQRESGSFLVPSPPEAERVRVRGAQDVESAFANRWADPSRPGPAMSRLGGNSLLEALP